MGRPNDGVATKFREKVVPELLALTPDFVTEQEAQMWYRQLRKRAWFKRRFEDIVIPDEILFEGYSYDCVRYAEGRLPGRDAGFIIFGDNPNNVGVHPNPIELLHVLAHFLQSEHSPWHGAEFTKAFRDLVERAFDADMRRAVADILLDHGIKTKVIGPETRAKQRDAYMRRKAAVDRVRVPQAAIRLMREARKLGQHDG